MPTLDGLMFTFLMSNFELLDNGQDITFKASNYFKSAGEVGDLSLDPVTGDHEAEDLIVF